MCTRVRKQKTREHFPIAACRKNAGVNVGPRGRFFLIIQNKTKKRDTTHEIKQDTRFSKHKMMSCVHACVHSKTKYGNIFPLRSVLCREPFAHSSIPPLWLLLCVFVCPSAFWTERRTTRSSRFCSSTSPRRGSTTAGR